VLIAARIGAFFLTFPLFRSSTLPRLVKVVLALALSVMWLANFLARGALDSLHALPTHWLEFGLAAVRESIVGAGLGYLLGLFFLPAQVAGAYLGQEMGFNLAGVTDPTTESTSNVFGDLLNALAMMTFLLADAHQLAIGTLYVSFARLPLASPLPELAPWVFTQSLSDAHRWGMELAAPMAVGLFLTTVVTVLLMKISPQLNLFAVGIPVRLALGLLAAFVFFPDIVLMMERIFLREAWFIQQLGLK
jgi:flagellar biosynthetic protein FliR